MEKIIFSYKGENIIYFEDKNSSGFYLNYNSNNNSFIFTLLGMNYDQKGRFTKKVLGYFNGGGFPYCKSKDDLYKLVEAIKKLLNTEIDLLCL